LFIATNVLMVPSTTATSTMTKGRFIVTSRPAAHPAEFSWFRNEPRVNILSLRRSKNRFAPRERADHPVYAMTIVAAIAVVKAKASAIAAKIILIACP